MTKFFKPYARASACHVFYSNGEVSHIIADHNESGIPLKASMIFQYGKNGKCSKIYYKNFIDQVQDNSAKYFTDLTDGKLYPAYDSLVYSGTDQLLKIYRLDYVNKVGIKSLTQLYYQDLTDTIINKLEEYRTGKNGNLVLADQLLVTMSAIPNPARNNLWFFPFVFTLTDIVGKGSNVMAVPFLFDDPSTYLDKYLTYANKCVSAYKVFNNWGVYNYTNSRYNYHFSVDSLLLKAELQDRPSIYVNYRFKKSPRL